MEKPFHMSRKRLGSHSGIQFGLSEMGVAVSLSCALACWQQPAQRPAVTRAWLVLVAVLWTRTWVVSSTRSCSLPVSVITGILAGCCSPTSPAPTLFEEPLVQAVWAAEKLGLETFWLSTSPLLTGLWRCNLYTTQFTHLKDIIQWGFLVYSQSCLYVILKTTKS